MQVKRERERNTHTVRTLMGKVEKNIFTPPLLLLGCNPSASRVRSNM